MLKLTYGDFEEEARALCWSKDIDPDALVIYPDPNGYAVCRRRAAWINYAIQLHQHWQMSGLVSRARRRLGL